MSSIKSNFIYTLIYNVLNILVPFVTTPYISRILGVENSGIYAYSYSIANYFVIFILMGLTNYGNRSIALVKKDKRLLERTFWDIYYMQFFGGILFLIIYIIYSNLFSDYIVISYALAIYVISGMFDITWFFLGIEDFKFITIRNFIVKLTATILIFIFVKNANDLLIYTLLLAVSMFLSQIFLWIKIYRKINFKRPIIKRSIKHLKPNLILFIPVIAISIYNIMDKIMLGSMSDVREVGYYDYSEKIANMPQIFVTALGTVMLPRISSLLSTGAQESIDNYLRKSIVVMGWVSSFFTLFLILVSKEFIYLFLGDGYERCIILLNFLMPCLIFKAFANVIRTQYLIPYQKDNIYVVSVCAGAIINFLINIILIPQYKAIGACLGTVIAEMIVFFIQFWLLNRSIDLKRYILVSFGFQIMMLILVFISKTINFGDNYIVSFIEKIIYGTITYATLSIIYLRILKSRGGIYE